MIKGIKETMHIEKSQQKKSHYYDNFTINYKNGIEINVTFYCRKNEIVFSYKTQTSNLCFTFNFTNVFFFTFNWKKMVNYLWNDQLFLSKSFK